MKMESPNCVICYEKFNKTIRQPIDCESCPARTCKGCFKIGSKNSEEMPKCFSCNEPFTSAHIYSMSPSLVKFIRSTIGDLDIEREKNLLPLAQSYIEDCVRADELVMEAFRIEMESRNLLDQANRLRRQARSLITGEEMTVEKEKVERAVFICPCPSDGCNGFLNNRYHCSLCKIDTCPDCRNILAEGEEHICKEDDVKAVQFIKKTTKPCPKCGIRIHRPGGCDHMFCTNPGCATSFSWSSGKVIEENKNTNPHYYAWKRKQEGGLSRQEDILAARQRDNVCGMTNREIIFAVVRHRLVDFEKARRLQHVMEIEIPKYEPDNLGNRDLGVKYLLKEIDGKKWLSSLKRRRKKKELNHEIYQILSAYLESSIDLFRDSLSLRIIVPTNHLKELMNLFQESLDNTTVLYNSSNRISIKNMF